MAYITVPYGSESVGGTILSSHWNANFQAIVDGLSDGTKQINIAALAATTGTFSGALAATTGTFSSTCTFGGTIETSGTTIPLGTSVTAITGKNAKNQPKAWASVSESAGTYTLQDNYGVTSITKNGTGDITVNWSTSFATANYFGIATPNSTNSRVAIVSLSSSSMRVFIIVPSTLAAIDTSFVCMAMGAQ